MKISNPILSLLTLSLCRGSVLNDVSNLLFGDTEAVVNDNDLAADFSGTDYIEFIHNSLGSELGDIPKGAREAWDAVVDEVPNGAQLLLENIKSQINLLKSANSPKTKPKKVIDYSNLPENKWLHTVQDEKFPGHGLRIKSPKSLGADNVTQYSGYLDAEEKHFFFWFFESRSDPANDPVVLWLNGGPGCSSMTGLFFELGPSSVDANLKLVRNDYSWNEKANVIFLDQPVNVGFSHSDEGVSDTVTAGKDVYAFLELFFKQFPEYNNLDFHIAGESYAGHYIPVFASEIMSHDDRGFNLTSVLIGNGLTDPLRQYDFYEPMACGKGGHEAVLDEETCQGMLDKQPRCNSLIESCYESQSAWSCVPATIYCNNAAIGPYQQTGLNVYDIREPCADSSSGLCYPELEYIGKYLNQPHVREALGAEVENFEECNFDINRNFVFTGDWMKPYYTAVSELLAKDVPVLIYAGDKDYICNWLGNEGWSRVLEWTGKDTFDETKLSPWTFGKSEVGQVRNYEHFTFLRVYEAGHMVPFNQPEASLEMLNRWIAGDYTFSS